MLLASNSAGQRDPLTGLQTSPAFRQAISDAAKKYKISGIAAALIEHGRLRSIEVFGVRDLKSNAPVTVNTICEAGHRIMCSIWFQEQGYLFDIDSNF
jgi:hypothetical protein